MPAVNTDSIADDLIDYGFDPETAYEYAMDYITSGAFGVTPEEFADTVDTINEFRPDYIEPGNGDLINFNDDAAIDLLDDYNRGEPDEQIEYDIDELVNENNSIFRVGCDFEGIMGIQEYEDEKVYIPDSNYCIMKCYEKYFQLIGRDYKFDTNGLTPYGETLEKAKAKVLETLKKCQCPPKHRNNCAKVNCKCTKDHTAECKELRANIKNLLPPFVKYGKIGNKNGFFRVNTHDDFVTYSIVLLPFGNSYYHACLTKIDFRRLKKTDYPITFTKDERLVAEFVRMMKPKIKEPSEIVYAYDIETYINTIVTPDCVKHQLIPYALSYSRVNLVSKEYSEPEVITMEDGKNIFDELIIALAMQNPNGKVQIFAHNGSKFDNIYVKSCTVGKFVDQIQVGATLKSLKVTYAGTEIQFKDSIAFTLASLLNSGKFLKCKQLKDEFDIVGKDLEWYRTNDGWVNYLKQDVRALAEILIKLEELINEYSESITCNLGLPSFAWKVMTKNCHGLSKTWVPKHPSMINLIKASIYGGRVIHWKKTIDSVTDDMYICCDANSLYPSAMFSSSFPTGQARVIEDFTDFTIDRYKHFIVTVEIEAPNIRYPYHPYKNSKGYLLYQVGKFIGTYNDVDIKEMIKDGYVITKYINGIYWTESYRIFGDLIETLYQRRKEVGGDSPLGYFIKILLNSLYGKLLEMIKSTSSFKENKTNTPSRVITLVNGQTEFRSTLRNAIVKKPLHLASYVLSNSRKIMNEIIRAVGPDNIAYGDTDSIYIAKTAFKPLEPYMNNNLCGFKNDYGDDKWVTNAIFLDLKRYYLEFNKGDSKFKFNGLNFKDKNTIANYKAESTYSDAVKQIYLDIKANYENTTGQSVNVAQEKFVRNNLGVVINHKLTKYSINPKLHANWIGDDYYPIGFDFDKPTVPQEKINEIGKHRKDVDSIKKLDYSERVDIDRISLRSSRPLVCTGEKSISISADISKIGALITDYVKYEDNAGKVHLLYREAVFTRKGETVEETHLYYTMKPFGPYKLFEEEVDENKVSFVLSVDKFEGPQNNIPKKDLHRIMVLLNKVIKERQNKQRVIPEGDLIGL